MSLSSPDIYHIVHFDKLPHILADGFLFSDALMQARGGNLGTVVGMSKIKARRLALEVECCPGLMVGACVPFYFCPRSVMLYLLHMGNHIDIPYKGGQRPIVHLVFDLRTVVEWAQSKGLHWAITMSNAGSNFFESTASLDGLDRLNWDAINNHDFRNTDVKEAKQAEFLVEDRVRWQLVKRIGVVDSSTQQTVQRILNRANHSATVDVERDWYY